MSSIAQVFFECAQQKITEIDDVLRSHGYAIRYYSDYAGAAVYQIDNPDSIWLSMEGSYGHRHESTQSRDIASRWEIAMSIERHILRKAPWDSVETLAEKERLRANQVAAYFTWKETVQSLMDFCSDVELTQLTGYDDIKIIYIEDRRYYTFPRAEMHKRLSAPANTYVDTMFTDPYNRVSVTENHPRVGYTRTEICGIRYNITAFHNDTYVGHISVSYSMDERSPSPMHDSMEEVLHDSIEEDQDSATRSMMDYIS